MDKKKLFVEKIAKRTRTESPEATTKKDERPALPPRVAKAVEVAPTQLDFEPYMFVRPITHPRRITVLQKLHFPAPQEQRDSTLITRCSLDCPPPFIPFEPLDFNTGFEICLSEMIAELDLPVDGSTGVSCAFFGDDIVDDEAHASTVKPPPAARVAVQWPDVLVLPALPFSPTHISNQTLTVVVFVTARQTEGVVGTGVFTLNETPTKCILVRKAKPVGTFQVNVQIQECQHKSKRAANRRLEKLQNIKSALRKRMGKRVRNRETEFDEVATPQDLVEDGETMRRKTLNLLANEGETENGDEGFDSGEDLDEKLAESSWVPSFE